MPHAVDSGDGDPPAEQNDDNLIAQMLNPEGDFLQDLLNNPQGDGGEKSHDAVDYEDISDDELPEEEDAVASDSAPNGLAQEIGLDQSSDAMPLDLGQDNGGGLEDDIDMDDLFGESFSPPPEPSGSVTDVLQEASGNVAALPRADNTQLSLPGALKSQDGQDLLGLEGLATGEKEAQSPDFDLLEDDESEEDEALLEQRRLFALSSERYQRGGAVFGPIPPEPETNDELFQTLFPDFDPEKRPRFNKLFPAKAHTYRGREPLKPPKVLQPTKINLELSQDQERNFRLPGSATTHEKIRQDESTLKGVVMITEADAGEEGSDEEVEYDEIDENETIGGISWADLSILCEDWDVDKIEALAAEEHANGESYQDKVSRTTFSANSFGC
jgi:transcription initiation factor TFIID subunit 1, fungi type